jgi:hypothetical protein
MTSLRRGATAAYRWLTIVFFVGVVVQFFLAGYGAFGSGFGGHETLGRILQGIAVLLLVLVLIARPTRIVFVPYLVLFVLAAVLQPILADPGNGVVGGLHGLDAVLIFGLAGWLGHRAFRREVTAR